MKKVNILGFVSVDEMIEKVKSEIEYLNNGYEWEDIKNIIIENGSGVYEFLFGCRGGLDDFIKNDEYQYPVLSPKYDIGFIVSNCGLPHLEVLEPWCSTIYVKDDMQLIVPDYIKKEQPNTNFDLQERIKPYDNEKQNNILVSFDASKLTNQNFQLLTQLTEIIKDSGEVGTFNLDIFTIDIIYMTEYQNNLIKL